MDSIHQILNKYYGYTSFRSIQQDIIESVLHQKDTLALLPTGGGKSICYQIPALVQEGICIVVTPLIALMKDQIDQLVKMDIKAVGISSHLSLREIDIILSNCIYGKVKFLFVSPERLNNEMFKARVLQMQVCLIAIDEAHCISQWGHDFRPSYMKISELRLLLPKVPIIALTATATPQVINEIQERLAFKEPNVLSTSFYRKNLTYYVLQENGKFNRVVNICKKINGSGIIYVRNRKTAVEVSNELQKIGHNANYYHAGLPPNDRANIQQAWQLNKIRILVCTNAFGMGINKPDVRFVIHIDLPNTLESYFQEAGRAGRDEQNASAIILYNQDDVSRLNYSLQLNYPSLEYVRKVYQALCNFFTIAIGGGEFVTFPFDINEVCKKYNLQLANTQASIKLLERDAFLVYNDAYFKPARIHFLMKKNTLYAFQLANIRYDSVIKAMLRNYKGLFDEYTMFNENHLARLLGISENALQKILNELVSQQVIFYQASSNLPTITFLTPRYDAQTIVLSKQNYEQRRHNDEQKIKSVVTYVQENNLCRSIALLRYLSEDMASNCGKCDVCIRNNIKHKEELIQNKILDLLNTNQKNTINSLLNSFNESEKVIVNKILRQLIDSGYIKANLDQLIIQTKKTTL